MGHLSPIKRELFNEGPSTKGPKRISRYAKRIRPRKFLIRGMKSLLETTLEQVEDTGRSTECQEKTHEEASWKVFLEEAPSPLVPLTVSSTNY
jgi:hypothetical protein